MATVIVVIVVAALLILYLPSLLGDNTGSVTPAPQATVSPRASAAPTPTPVPSATPAATPSPTASAAAAVVYTDAQYGFAFALPDTWQGYTIVADTWEGVPPGEETATESGPIVSIRHPQWTEAAPRQDIPIMVFTLDQWNGLTAEEFHIGAAPVNPSELGRNSQYVLALPARYNFSALTGYEEVEQILAGNPLTPIEPGQG